MKVRFVVSLIASLVVTGAAFGQDAASNETSDIIVPDSTMVQPWHRGFRAHTNHLILNTSARFESAGGSPNGGLGPSGGMTPAQVRSFYNMPSTGGAGVIAVVIAYDYPTALNDFNVFSTQFGLPKETSTSVTASTNSVFQVVYAGASKPGGNSGWNQEAALDIEWTHSMAPNAKIVLVEANSPSYVDLFAAVDKARTIPGVKQISMSWGGSEFSGETAYDSRFVPTAGIVYFASSGDTGGVVEYPSCSPNVVAVGGTRVNTDTSGNFVSETGWSGSGGGTSLYEAKPSFQSVLAAAKRAVPDISAIADPNTGVCVYDSTAYRGSKGWMVFGGTSVACPCMAGMTNLSGSKYSSPSAQLSAIYAQLGSSTLRDILSGTAGSFTAGSGWDFVTGVGAPLGTSAL